MKLTATPITKRLKKYFKNLIWRFLKALPPNGSITEKGESSYSRIEPDSGIVIKHQALFTNFSL